jgi:hypothetical protein
MRFRNFAIALTYFYRIGRKIQGQGEKKASVETPALENFSYDNHYLVNDGLG